MLSRYRKACTHQSTKSCQSRPRLVRSFHFRALFISPNAIHCCILIQLNIFFFLAL